MCTDRKPWLTLCRAECGRELLQGSGRKGLHQAWLCSISFPAPPCSVQLSWLLFYKWQSYCSLKSNQKAASWSVTQEKRKIPCNTAAVFTPKITRRCQFRASCSAPGLSAGPRNMGEPSHCRLLCPACAALQVLRSPLHLSTMIPALLLLLVFLSLQINRQHL